MLAMSPLFPSLGWDNPMELGTQQAINLDNYYWNLDALIIPNNNFSSSQVQDNHDLDHDHDDHLKRSSESQQSASSGDQFYATNDVLAKKLNHNASERDRRKKINYLYSTLRALLPANDHTKKLSIPATVGRVLKYIPELQKEVDDLVLRKDAILSKISLLQVDTSEFTVQEKKPRIKDIVENKHCCSISVNKLGDGEIVIQISSVDNISLPEVLLKVEKDGLIVLDVSSFRSFGGTTFYNIHLWIEGDNNVIKSEKLNEELSLLVQKQNMKQNQSYY